MAARIEPLITVDDLDSMPEDGNRYEVIEGELFGSRAPGVVKRQLYAKYGVAKYCIVNAENRAIEVYRLQNGTLELAVIFRYEDEITIPLLPGFKCSVARIFC